MGFYIETTNGSVRNKAQHFIEQHGALRLAGPVFIPPTPEGRVAVCVVSNPVFDAAAIAYDEQEFRRFIDPEDGRPKTWIAISVKKAVDLCPRFGRWLEANPSLSATPAE